MGLESRVWVLGGSDITGLEEDSELGLMLNLRGWEGPSRPPNPGLGLEEVRPQMLALGSKF